MVLKVVRALRPARHGRPQGRHYVLFAICATLLLLTACGKKEEEEAGPVVTIDVAPVLSSQIQRIVRAQALVYPKQQAAIVPKITAPIRKVYVEKGAKVKAGQLLVELENADL